MRYQSAYGLKRDLIECQQRLLATVSSASDDSSEVLLLSFACGLFHNYHSLYPHSKSQRTIATPYVGPLCRKKVVLTLGFLGIYNAH